MNNVSDYLNFIKTKGRPLSEINPGSDEYALNIEDTLSAINLLKESQIAILGGDILSEKNNKLIYAHQYWGAEYHSLNWYCEKSDGETQTEYVYRSYFIATQNINKAAEIANKLDRICLIVFVV